VTDLTVKTVKTPECYEFIRSDGHRFFLVGTEDGHAVLYAGNHRSKQPAIGIVHLDVGYLRQTRGGAPMGIGLSR